jgi:hypothetical protein
MTPIIAVDIRGGYDIDTKNFPHLAMQRMEWYQLMEITPYEDSTRELDIRYITAANKISCISFDNKIFQQFLCTELGEPYSGIYKSTTCVKM